MGWLATFGIAIFNAIAGCAGAVGLGVLVVDWYRVSGFEGGSGYLVVVMGFLGALVSFVIGLICSRIVAGGVDPNFGKALGLALATTASILLILIAGFRFAADLPATYQGRSVSVQIELRAPAGFEFPTGEVNHEWYASIDTHKRRMTSRTTLNFTNVREENDRKVIPIRLELNTSMKEKLLNVHLGERSTERFTFSFDSPGQRELEWSDWMDAAEEDGKPSPPFEQRFNIRYKLVTTKED